MLVGFAPLTLLIINLNTEKILSVDSVNSDTALQIYFNLRVRPSIQFGQPPPSPINFVHVLELNYFQQKSIYLYYFRLG